MLAAALEGHELIDGRLVRQVVRDLEADLPASFTPTAVQRALNPNPWPRRLSRQSRLLSSPRS